MEANFPGGNQINLSWNLSSSPSAQPKHGAPQSCLLVANVEHTLLISVDICPFLVRHVTGRAASVQLVKKSCLLGLELRTGSS